jgi:cell division protein FtsI (penicillin-binding protein 3)
MSIGYEIKISPLQTLTFYNAIANNGKMVKPYLVNSIKAYDKTIKKFDPTVIDKAVVKEATAFELKKLLEAVFDEGTGSNLTNTSFKLAGKSGTSRIANEKTNYRDKVYQASFVGYFPADKPMYSCIVVVNNPKNGRYYGSSVAGPVFSEIAQKIFASNRYIHKNLASTQALQKEVLPSLGGVSREDAKMIYNKLGVSFHASESSDFGITKKSLNAIELKPTYITEYIVPNVLGMDLKDALFILENAGLKVEVAGVGRVKNQSLKPGQDYSKGQKIKIQLAL